MLLISLQKNLSRTLTKMHTIRETLTYDLPTKLELNWMQHFDLSRSLQCNTHTHTYVIIKVV